MLKQFLRSFSSRKIREHLLRKECFEALYAKHKTEDGLIPCSALTLSIRDDHFWLAFTDNLDVEVFPVQESDFVLDILIRHPALWNKSAIRLSYCPEIWGSGKIYGVPFKKAIEFAAKNGIAKSMYYLPEIHRDGRFESLLIHLRKVNDVRGSLLQMEAWQYSPGSDYAYYLHAMSTDFRSKIIHLDGATIKYSEGELDTLLKKSKKVKGTDYQKFFRLDGEISVNDMHMLAKAFLPGEELYEEAFGITDFSETSENSN